MQQADSSVSPRVGASIDAHLDHLSSGLSGLKWVLDHIGDTNASELGRSLVTQCLDSLAVLDKVLETHPTPIEPPTFSANGGFDVLLAVTETDSGSPYYKPARLPYLPRVGDMLALAPGNDYAEVAYVHWSPSNAESASGFEIWLQDINGEALLTGDGWVSRSELQKAEAAEDAL